jgi:hypothetical protein
MHAQRRLLTSYTYSMFCVSMLKTSKNMQRAHATMPLFDLQGFAIVHCVVVGAAVLLVHRDRSYAHTITWNYLHTYELCS